MFIGRYAAQTILSKASWSPADRFHFQTGEICLDLLKDQWSAVNTLVTTLEAIYHMFNYPEPDSPLNVDIAVLMRNGDLIGAESVIRWACNEWRWEGR